MHGVSTCLTYLGCSFDGRDAAFLYVWFSVQERFFYVGQSNNRLGSFGRAGQHISSGGTLRARVEGEYGIPLEDVGDLALLSFRLPSLPDLTSVESSYREGVEFLVQRGINERRLELGRGFRVVSVIRYTDAAALGFLKQIADFIVDTTIHRVKVELSI